MDGTSSFSSSSVVLMSSMVGSWNHHGSISSIHHHHRLNNRMMMMQQQVTIRSFGVITDTISKMVNNKMESDKEKKFTTLMATMLSGEKWSLRQWKKTMEDQLNSWVMYVPGMRSSAQVQDLTTFKALLDALSDSELDDPDLINGKARERIATSTGKPIDDVHRLIMFYKQSKIIQEWLVLKKSNNEAMPKSEFELMRMQEDDVRLRNIANKILNPKKRQGRGRSIF